MCIIDEIDSVLFLNDNGLHQASKLLPKLKFAVGFTGSDLKEFHIRAAVKVMDGTYVRMVIQDSYKPLPLCHGVDVYNKVSE